MNSKQVKLSKETDNTRRKLYLEFVCASAEIKSTGSQMEHYFEPDMIAKNKESGRVVRSCKYDRYFKGRNPSRATLELIEAKITGSYLFYYSTLWHALNLIRCKDNDYEQFYSRLPLEVLNVIYLPKKNEFNQWQRRAICHNRIKELMIIGGLDSLACLLAFRMERSKDLLHINISVLDANIFLLFSNCCVINPLSIAYIPLTVVSKHLYQFIKQQFTLINEDLGGGWENNEDYLSDIINDKEYLLSLAIQRRVVKYDYICHPFLYWAYIGNEELIKYEMEYYEIIGKGNIIALRQLVRKINPHYPKPDRIRI